MTLRAGDKIREGNFINRSERNATPSNDADKVPRLDPDGFLHSEFIKNILSLKTRETFDGSATPVPVLIGSDSYLQRSEADVVGRTGFYGFVKEATTGKFAEFLNGQQYTTAASQSHTVNAGTDRIVIIEINFTAATTVSPTGVTWNGITCTRLLTSHGTNAGQDVWYCVAGNSGTNQTGNIVITGGTGQTSVFATNWQYVDQASPFQGTPQIVRQGSGTSIATTITLEQSVGAILQFHTDSNGNAVTIDSKLVERYVQGTSRKQADGTLFGARTLNFTSSTAGAAYTAANPGIGSILALKNSTSQDDTIEVWHEGIVSGFSGLTPGAEYFISNTLGTISTTPGTAMIKVGTAISATQILIQKSQQVASGVASLTSATDQVIFCGFRPSRVRVWAVADGGGVTNHSFGGWDGISGNSCVYSGDDNGSGEQVASSTSLAWYVSRLTGGATISQGVIGSITPTGFTLDITFTGGTTLIRWEAEE